MEAWGGLAALCSVGEASEAGTNKGEGPIDEVGGVVDMGLTSTTTGALPHFGRAVGGTGGTLEGCDVGASGDE